MSEALRHLAHHPFVPTTSNTSCSANNKEECYGEVTEKGYEQVLQGMRLPGTSCELTASSVFVDVGMGYGRLAMYMRMRTNISRVVGVETNACRYRRACRGRETLRRADASVLANGLEFAHADVRDFDLKGATHLFMSITCWSEDLIRSILTKVMNESPSVRCVILNAWRAKHLLGKRVNGHPVELFRSQSGGAKRGNSVASTTPRAASDGNDLMSVVDRWGRLDGAKVNVPTTWLPTEVLYIGSRACDGAHCPRRSAGTSVRDAPVSTSDIFGPVARMRGGRRRERRLEG